MGVDTSFYVLLDNALDNQEEIVLNRSSTDRKLQTVAVKSFMDWRGKFESLANGFLSRKVNQEDLTDQQLKGEKNLARLRFFSRFWKGNASRVENLNFNSAKDLEKEKERIKIAIDRLQAFRKELGGAKLNVDSIDHKLTKNDEKAFERLTEAIDKLQAKAHIIDKVQHNLKGVKEGKWNIESWLNKGIEETLQKLSDKSKQTGSMTTDQLKQYRQELKGAKLELLKYEKAGLNVKEAINNLDETIDRLGMR